MIEALNKKGWKIFAKLLNKYKGKVEQVFKKILKNEAMELIDVIGKMRDDIIKIIKGGHIEPMNDEDMEVFNPFDDSKTNKLLCSTYLMTVRLINCFVQPI